MVPFDKQSVTVVRQSKVGVDTTYEPPLRVGFGISDKTVDLANAVMGRTVLVPGARAESDPLSRQQRRLLVHHVRQHQVYPGA